MLGWDFYYSLTRQYVTAFGNIFNEIYVNRVDVNNQTVQSFEVPIAYGPKEKWLYYIQQQPESTNVATILPRMSFEIISLVPDLTRKLTPTTKASTVVSDKNKLARSFVPVPMTMAFELNIMSKNADDAMQIVEQIIPFFNNDFDWTMELVPGLGKKFDVRLNLTSFTPQDTWTEDFNTRRVMIWKLSFEMKVWFFGPLERQGVIKRIQIDFHAVPGSGTITAEEVQNTARTDRIVFKPGLTANGTPTTSANNSIPYRQIQATDDYGFIEEHYTFSDGKRYDPISGEDV
jgi:hypothetical protein